MPTILTHYTVPELARLLSKPVWLVRRVVDSLGVAQRAGLYRIIPADQLDAVREALARRCAAMTEADEDAADIEEAAHA